MSDDLAPLFESRETRLGRLPEETRTRFAEAETAALAGGNTDFADKQFVSFWLSRRTGLPRRDVLTSFDALSKRYFGEGATAATAYDSIAKGYQPAGGGEKVPETKQGGGAEAIYAEVEGLPKAGKQAMIVNVEQAARVMPSGSAEVLWGAVGGFYSQAATVASAPGRPKSAFEDRTYLELSKERAQILRPPFWPYDYDKQPNEREAKRLAKIDSDMAVLKGRNDSANLERLVAFARSDSNEVSKEFRRLADTAYGIAKVADEAFGVDLEFANTTLGSFMKSAGSVPATAAMAVMGPGGWMGMEAMFFGQAEQERMEKEGAAYDPEKAAAGNLASAIPQAIMERAFGVERIMNKVLGDLPKMQGRVSFGDFAKGFIRNGLAAGVEEGLTEPAQGFWNDYVASLTYDQSRELFTAEKAKERLVESVSGFALGFLFGGGIAGVQSWERNRVVSAGERYLTTKDGETLTESDFRVMRDVKTDMELLATAPDAETGKILVAAANGDVKAQKDYNNRVMAALFVKTEDVDVEGISVGVVNDHPVVKWADGMIEPLDMTNEAHRTFLSDFKRRAVQVLATRDTLAELQKRHGDGLEVTQAEKLLSPQERVAAGTMTQEQADDALEAAKAMNGLAQDLTHDDIRPEGTATTTQTADGILKMVVEVANSANPTVAIEEVSEAYIQRAYKAQNLVPADLQDARVRWMEQNGETDAAAGFEGDKLDRANIEWFSKRVIEYALANRKTELPGGWGAWLRTLGKQLKKLLAGATRMKKLMRDGKLDPELEAWMKGAIGKPGDAFGMTSEKANAQAAEGNAEAAPVADEVGTEMIGEGTRQFKPTQNLSSGRWVIEDTTTGKVVDEMGFATEAQARRAVEAMNGKQLTVHALTLTPDMNAAVRQGQTTFSLEDITFAATGVPQNAQQSLQAQLQAIRAQRLAATGDLIVYRKKNPHAPQHTTAAIRSFESGVISKWMLPVSERLRYLGKTMSAMARLRRYEFDLGRNIIASYKMVKPLLTGMGQMNANDAELFGFAISNGDTVTRDRLLAAYNLGNAWAQYEAMRDGLRARALAAGMDVGYIEDYFPRWLKDRDGHRAFYEKTELGSQMDEALEKAQEKAGRVLTLEEENQIINNLIAGRRNGSGKPANLKERDVEIIEAGAWKFYAAPTDAVLRLIEQFEQEIAKRQFLGKQVMMLPSISAHAPSQIDVTNSIGAIANEMRRNGEIDAEGFEELVNVLDARFNVKLGDVSLLSHWGPTLKTMTSARTYMNLTYMVTMGRLTSALSQIPDLMISIYEAGPIDALAAVGKAAVENIGELPVVGNKESWREGVGKAVRSGKSVTTEKLGVDRIAAEFKDIRKTALALEQVFRLTGLTYMDRVGKQTLINAKTNQLRRQAKSGKFSAKNRAMLDNIFGKQKAAGVIADFAAGKETDDTLFAAYNVLADYQPISLSEYPEQYLKSPQSRILYMLKSYTIKQLAAYRREGFMLMWHGNAKQKAVGARNLMHLSALLMLAGVGTDWLKDWFMERDPQMDDLVVDNLFKLIGWNRWAVWRFRSRKKETTGMDDVSMIAGVLGDATQVGMDVIGPPLIWRYVTDDIRAYSKAMARGDDYNMADAASFQLIPVVGDQYYWRAGGGKKKTEKRRLERERELP